MQHAQQRGPHSVEESMMLWGVIFLFIGAGGWFLWWRYHGEISAAVMASQHWQMQQIGRLTDAYVGLDHQVLATDPSTVKIGALWRLLGNVGAFFRVPAVAIVGLLAVWCLFRSPANRFTRNITLPRLMRIQAEAFPAGAAFVDRGLKLTKPADGALRPADPSLHGREWIARYALGDDGAFNEDRAAHALGRQLGPEWTGLERAAPHVRCMFAAFALHATRQRDLALELLGILSASLPCEPSDGPAGPARHLAFDASALASADLVLADADLIGPCVAAASRHAFTATAMMSVLSLARGKAGVLAPAQFAFLKLVDRPLWYALHALGFPGGSNPAEQPNPRTEAAGARDHWAAECQVGQPLSAPSLDRALAVLRKLAATKERNQPRSTETTP